MDYAGTYPNFTYSFIKKCPKNTPQKNHIKSVFVVFDIAWLLNFSYNFIIINITNQQQRIGIMVPEIPFN